MLIIRTHEKSGPHVLSTSCLTYDNETRRNWNPCQTGVVKICVFETLQNLHNSKLIFSTD